MITSLKQRGLVKESAQAIHERAARGNRSLSREEKLDFDAYIDEIKEFDDRAALTRTPGDTGNTSASDPRFYTNDADVYHDPHLNPRSPSFFADVRNSKLGDWDAADRLRRNTQARGMETRTGDMASSSATAGGSFAPPLWLVSEFATFARPGRVTADLFQHETLPPGVSSINLPKVSGGATTGVQATQNSALSDTAMTTTSVSSGISLIGGKQIVSLQLLQQSGIPFDRVILGDLAASYAQQLDLGVLAGSGASGQLRGLNNAASAGSTIYTTTSPSLTSTTSANSFYNRVVAAATGIHTTRYLPATAVVMHPNRWAWCLEALDTTLRPLIITDGSSLNAAGTSTGIVAQGAAGNIVLPVYLDANVTTTVGAGSATNQDVCYVLRAPDMTLWESDIQVQSFDQTYADNASVLFRCLAYGALIVDKWAGSVNIISGTGLVAPVL
jgi:HK97 family phage major capsid protein